MDSQSEHYIYGEEDEDVLFDDMGDFWGKGKKKWCSVKLLKHKTSGKVRVLLTEKWGDRKIHANHPISSGMVVTKLEEIHCCSWAATDSINGEEMHFTFEFITEDDLKKFLRIFRESVESEERKKYDAAIQVEGLQKLLDNRAENAGAEVEHNQHIITGEEDEDVLLHMTNRSAQLNVREIEVEVWEAKHIGSVKFLKHKKSGKVRLVIKESKSLKICANHPISSGMVVKLCGGQCSACHWEATDFSDGVSKERKFGLDFKYEEDRDTFMQTFNESADIEDRDGNDAAIQLEEQQKLLDSRVENAGAEVERIITCEEDEDVLLQIESVESEERKKYDSAIQLEGQQKLLDNRAENTGAEVEHNQHIITDEEDEDVLFDENGLFFHKLKTKLCNVKLLKHKESGKLRVVVRKEQGLTIWLNHPISSGTILEVIGDQDFTIYGEEMNFFVKFDSKEDLKKFVQIFRKEYDAAMELEVQQHILNAYNIMQLVREAIESDEMEENYSAIQLERQLKLGDTKTENVGEGVPITEIEKQPVTEDGKSKTAHEETPAAVVIAMEKEVKLEKVIEVVKVVDVSKEVASSSSNSIEMLLGELGRKKIQPYSHKDLTGITENFSDQIGSGAYGDVFKGTLPNGAKVAVKKLKNTAMDVMEFTFMAEVRTMSSTLHRHLVVLYGYCFEANMKALVYEYLENGSFDKVLYENHLNLPWDKLYDIAVGTAEGLSYLHKGCVHEIIHYDIKPGNVLLDSKLSPKVADFGMAKVSQRDLSKISVVEFRGTRSYAAPEMWMQMPVTSKSDIYSFGMMLFEVLGRRSILDGENWLPGQVWEKFKTGKLDEIMDDFGIDEKNKSKAKILANVALWCTQFKPNDRPPMSVVVEVLLGNIQLPLPPDPFYPYFNYSGASTWGGGSMNISGPTASSVSSTTST